MNGPVTGTILAVDDQPANLDLLADILSGDDSPLRTHRVQDPRAALPTFHEIEPDLVLLDLNMPHLDGFVVMDQLLDVIPSDSYVPIIVMTADVDRETRRRALAAGAHDFVGKPFDPEEVRLRVRNFLRARQLHAQLKQERQELEVRVAERTRDFQRANERLLAADRMKSDFLAMVSHEMRTPLTVIKGFSEVIVRRWDGLAAPARASHVDAIRRNVDRLEDMIDNLLLAAELDHPDRGTQAIGAISPHSVRLDLLVGRAVEESGLDRASLRVEGARDTVIVDADMVQQILTNLLDNARKYGQPPVEISCRVDDTSVDIQVRDHGEGVPESFEPHLFDRFAQASVGDRRTSIGAGLGLWIARRLARAHGGELTYERSEPGARFHLRIPLPSA